MRGNFLYAVSIGACAGIALSLLLGFGTVLAGFCIVGALLVVIVARKNPLVLIIACGLCAIAFGLVRTEMFLEAEKAETVSSYLGKTAIVAGTVTNDPDRRETSLRVSVNVESVDGIGESGKILVILPREEELSYGDFVEVTGKIIQPESFETSTGHIFDYEKYLRVQGISVLMEYATLQNRIPSGPSVPGTLFSLKHFFEHSVERLLPEPDVSLLEGILLGERRGIPPALTNAFAQSGLVHVVVLSGYNIAVVSDAAMRLFSYLPRTLGISLGAFTMILFALMTGAGAATVRATIMGLIAILARYLRRSSAALRALALAAAAMALSNPLALLFDPSFILSVLATFGLITLSPFFENKLQFVTARGGLRSIAASTISVQLFVLPALLYFTGMLSYFALPANLLALPVVPFAMMLGFVAGLLGLLHPLLAMLPALFADVLLKWMIVVAQTTATLPFSTSTVAEIPPWIVVLAYIPLTYLALRLYNASLSRSN